MSIYGWSRNYGRVISDVFNFKTFNYILQTSSVDKRALSAQQTKVALQTVCAYVTFEHRAQNYPIKNLSLNCTLHGIYAAMYVSTVLGELLVTLAQEVARNTTY